MFYAKTDVEALIINQAQIISAHFFCDEYRKKP